MEETSHALQLVAQYGYFVIFIIVTIENIEFFGSFPTSVIVAAMGAVATEGLFDVTFSIILLTIASTLGDVIGYWLGKKFGRPLFERWGGKFATSDRLEKAERIVKKYGAWGIFITRFLFASLQAILNIVAGITRMRIIPFTIAAFLGELLWTLVYFALGYYFWPQVSGTLTKIGSFGIRGVILSLGVVILGYQLYKYKKFIFRKK